MPCSRSERFPVPTWRCCPSARRPLSPSSWGRASGVRRSSRFASILPAVGEWLAHAERQGSELAPLAAALLAALDSPADWVVHGDFHHHNILRHGERYVAIDAKPYAAEREYDVPSFLWNPMNNRLDDRSQLEDRIAAFVAAGLDDFRIRAWTIIRSAYLRPACGARLEALL
jgi:streptomycin 6-kinase